jgi:hypothetical protein
MIVRREWNASTWRLDVTAAASYRRTRLISSCRIVRRKHPQARHKIMEKESNLNERKFVFLTNYIDLNPFGHALLFSLCHK